MVTTTDGLDDLPIGDEEVSRDLTEEEKFEAEYNSMKIPVPMLDIIIEYIEHRQPKPLMAAFNKMLKESSNFSDIASVFHTSRDFIQTYMAQKGLTKYAPSIDHLSDGVIEYVHGAYDRGESYRMTIHVLGITKRDYYAILDSLGIPRKVNVRMRWMDYVEKRLIAEHDPHTNGAVTQQQTEGIPQVQLSSYVQQDKYKTVRIVVPTREDLSNVMVEIITEEDLANE